MDHGRPIAAVSRERDLAGGPAPRYAGVLVLALLAVASPAWPRSQPESGSLRVGVYDNPPIVLESAAEPGGLAVSVLEEIARLEGWRLEYRSCVWIDCLDWLGRGEIDLLVGIAYSAERARRFRFNRVTVISNFGVVYSAAGGAAGSLLELGGRRVAVMGGNIHALAFEEMMRSFDVECELVPVADFHAVMALVENGDVDAGVVNRLFSLENGRHYRAVETGIVFNPIEIRYATPLDGDREMLDAIDRRLTALKADPSSAYFAAVERLFGPKREVAPRWLAPAGVGAVGILGLALLGAAVLRRQVKVQTKALRRQSERLQSEVRERRKAQEELNRLAFFDSLTGLPNRLLFRDRLRQALAEARRMQGRAAVLFLDLDRFKLVNDTFGHSVGDELMRRIAGRLEGVLRETDTIGRVGGDEFTILLPGLDEPARVGRVARRLLDTLGRPFAIDDTQVVVTASVGSAVYPDDGSEVESLVGCADVAMYHAKEKGRDGYRAYEPAMATEASRRLTLDRDLRTAIAYENLVLEFQPIVELATGRIVAAEALARIVDREGHWVFPDRFISVAEESGLIHRFGGLVLERACRLALPWCTAGGGEIRLCVNVSPHQLEEREFLRRIDDALGAVGFPPSLLELELTEGVFLDRLPAKGTLLDSLRQRGIRLSIDDFGTGYSSLSYLSRLPLDALKIDQSFVQRVDEDRSAAEIIAAIVRMTRGLGLEAIAEGIESEDQLAFLRELGCPLGQGFLVSPPRSAEDFAAWLAKRSSGAAG